MRKNNLLLWLTCIALVVILVACGSSADLNSTNGQTATAVTSNMTTSITSAVNTIVDAASESDTTSASSVAEAIAENSATHDDATDYVWNSAQTTQITLTGDTISVTGEGVTVDGSQATITAAGSYTISGSLTDGQILVNTTDEEVVRLILNGVDITSSTNAPIAVISAAEAMVVLADNSQNTITDGASYVFANPEEDEPNAAIFSKSDLTISGNGSLTVNGNYNDGIASKDGLIIAGGVITVNAADDAIRGKDYLVVKAGAITANAQGDGLKSDDEEDAANGYISIEGGVVHVTAGGDAIQAATDVIITTGEFTLSSGGGSGSVIDESTSAKGIKAVVNLNIDGGTFTIDSADDALHANGSLVINGGTFTISSGDDGMHADATLTINEGDIHITRSYEGIESAVITINGGNIHTVSSDDGVNVASGNDGSGGNFGPGFGGGPAGRPGRGGATQDSFTYTGDYYLYINGGYSVVDAAGDGLDVNGAIEMTGGVVIVNGPTEQMNGAVDYDGTFNITGGFLVAAGSAGMAQAPGAASTQNSLLLNFNGTLPANTLVHIQTTDGVELLTFAPAKAYQSITFSSPELTNGMTYNVYYDGSTTGTETDGLYQGGVYTPGTQYTSFTVRHSLQQ